MAGQRNVARFADTHLVTGLAFSPDGTAVATGSGDNDGTVQVWGVKNFHRRSYETRPAPAAARPDSARRSTGVSEFAISLS
ncbi:hypothetical protein [Streptomyces sp. BP-8]|uniref:WD40 repeat domain-containing protein n=1 Tax=Streptomyces sirii TaxID=3127701 RepID=UPI00389072EF